MKVLFAILKKDCLAVRWLLLAWLCLFTILSLMIFAVAPGLGRIWNAVAGLTLAVGVLCIVQLAHADGRQGLSGFLLTRPPAAWRLLVSKGIIVTCCFALFPAALETAVCLSRGWGRAGLAAGLDTLIMQGCWFLPVFAVALLTRNLQGFLLLGAATAALAWALIWQDSVRSPAEEYSRMRVHDFSVGIKVMLFALPLLAIPFLFLGAVRNRRLVAVATVWLGAVAGTAAWSAQAVRRHVWAWELGLAPFPESSSQEMKEFSVDYSRCVEAREERGVNVVSELFAQGTDFRIIPPLSPGWFKPAYGDGWTCLPATVFAETEYQWAQPRSYVASRLQSDMFIWYARLYNRWRLNVAHGGNFRGSYGVAKERTETLFKLPVQAGAKGRSGAFTLEIVSVESGPGYREFSVVVKESRPRKWIWDAGIDAAPRGMVNLWFELPEAKGDRQPSMVRSPQGMGKANRIGHEERRTRLLIIQMADDQPAELLSLVAARRQLVRGPDRRLELEVSNSPYIAGAMELQDLVEHFDLAALKHASRSEARDIADAVASTFHRYFSRDPNRVWSNSKLELQAIDCLKAIGSVDPDALSCIWLRTSNITDLWTPALPMLLNRKNAGSIFAGEGGSKLLAGARASHWLDAVYPELVAYVREGPELESPALADLFIERQEPAAIDVLCYSLAKGFFSWTPQQLALLEAWKEFPFADAIRQVSRDALDDDSYEEIIPLMEAKVRTRSPDAIRFARDMFDFISPGGDTKRLRQLLKDASPCPFEAGACVQWLQQNADKAVFDAASDRWILPESA